MPYIGRYTRYPIYPEFGADPLKFNNILAVTMEKDLFTPGSTLDYQFKVGSSEIRVYDFAIEFYTSEVDFSIIEGATCADGVTPVPIDISDRNSSFVSSIYVSSDPTGISGGVPVNTMEHFGLPAPLVGIGDVPPFNVNYLTLKFNSNYIFRFSNVGTEDIIDFRFIVLWAE